MWNLNIVKEIDGVTRYFLFIAPMWNLNPIGGGVSVIETDLFIAPMWNLNWSIQLFRLQQ